MEKILVSEQFPQPMQTWTDNPYKLATEISRWANSKRLKPRDIVSISIFPTPLFAENAVGAVVWYWS